MSDVLVVGCGLIGTSIGLALQGSELADVTLHDASAASLDKARERGAGRVWDGREPADLVVVAVSPAMTATVLLELQSLNIGATYTHTSSVQSHVQREVQTLSSDPAVVVGGHPLAGRELGGAGAALADLFVGRPWAVCPGPTTASDAVLALERLALACGGTPLRTSAEHHDQAVGLLSHLPQAVASGLASVLLTASPGAQLALSGQGLVDTTRLAASDPVLWAEILEANATHVAPVVHEVVQCLEGLERALRTLADGNGDLEGARTAVAEFMRRGNEGRALVPVKRGALSEAFGTLRVQLPDRPGQLAALLVATGEAGINVEDLHVDHVPGRPTGVVELLVDGGSLPLLRATLLSQDWRIV